MSIDLLLLQMENNLCNMEQKKIAVVGAGYAGIVTIANLKAEGLHPVCFERTENYGGTWFYRERCPLGLGSTMPTTTINHSKEMGAMSNFPPPKECHNFMKHSDLYQYFSSYAKHNDCERHIKFNTEVIAVRKADDYEETGRWLVTTNDMKTEEKVNEIYDGVLVCTGYYSVPYIPDFPGQELFKGKIIHTHDLKDVEEFANKTVVVVGIGCSALDAAVETSRVAKQVYISTRNGAFILSRVGPNGYPLAATLIRRYLTFFMDRLPLWFANWYIETFYLNSRFNHKLMSIEPKYGFLSKDLSLNDHITAKLLSGSVIMKQNIHHFVEGGVVFEGDENVTLADVVIMGTGYNWAFPFLEEGVVVTQNGRINLYKCMYPSNLPHSTMAIMGFFVPTGPGFPMTELQGRWAAYNLAQKNNLPPEEIMMEDIIKRHGVNSKRFCPSDRMTLRVDYVQYLDEIAEQIGVKPNILKYMFSDFSLFLRLVFGPSLPYQYRLEGHGKWKGARNAILTSHKRVKWPLQQKEYVKKSVFESVLEYILNLLPLNIHVLHF